MLQLLEDNFCLSSISNMFTTLPVLFNTTQGDKEGLHEFCARFEGHVNAPSQSSMAFPLILQVMLFLHALHFCYQDLITRFTSKQKDQSSTTINSVVVVADTKLWKSSSWWVSNPNQGLLAHLLALRLLQGLSLIRMARSTALPGSGLLHLTQLLLSHAGVNLSRAALLCIL
jgi:hypothetical protein